MTWQEDHIAHGERMIAYARSTMPPGQIGAVPLAMTIEIESCGSADYPAVPVEIVVGQPSYAEADHHRRSEEDFNALVAIELTAGRISLASAEQAASNFHTYMTGNRYVAPQTSPRFYQ